MVSFEFEKTICGCYEPAKFLFIVPLDTDVGDVDCYVREGETGFLVGVAKVKYLAAGLERLWRARENLRQMG